MDEDVHLQFQQGVGHLEAFDHPELMIMIKEPQASGGGGLSEAMKGPCFASRLSKAMKAE